VGSHGSFDEDSVVGYIMSCHLVISALQKKSSLIDNEFTQPTSIIGWFVEVH